MSRCSRVGTAAFWLFAFLFVVVSPSFARAQSSASAPAPAPTSDGTAIDQGVAYMLMLVALVLTYLIHPLGAASSSTFF